MTSTKYTDSADKKGTDFIYNNDMFVNVLSELIGTQKKADFAAAAGISASHISRILQEKVTNRPTRHTVQKLASTTTDPLLLEKLFRVTGYNYAPPTQMDPDSDHTEDLTKKPPVNVCEQFFYIMMDYLAYLRNEKNIRWILDKGSKDSPFLSVTLPDGPIDACHITFISNTDTIPDNIRRQKIYLLYGQLATCDNSHRKEKVIYVTDSPTLYDVFTKLQPHSLNALVSIVLIDLEKRTIEKEEYLSSNAPFVTDTEKEILRYNIS